MPRRNGNILLLDVDDQNTTYIFAPTNTYVFELNNHIFNRFQKYT
jgi:hypothetical protein